MRSCDPGPNFYNCLNYKTFNSLKNHVLKKHSDMTLQAEKKYICNQSECQESEFSSVRQLAGHMDRHCEQNINFKINCIHPTCASLFSSGQSLQNHLSKLHRNDQAQINQPVNHSDDLNESADLSVDAVQPTTFHAYNSNLEDELTEFYQRFIERIKFKKLREIKIN